MLSEEKYRYDIQVFRGIAVLAIIFFHSKNDFFPLGYLGVDVFFVISGFVVTPLILRIFLPAGTIKNSIINLADFYRRRFYRLAPALTVILSISAVAIIFLGPPRDHARFAHQAIATLFLLGNVGAFKYSGDYFSTNPNPLVHTWSLSVEEQIYILLPIILLLIISNRRNLKKAIVQSFLFLSIISLITFLFPALLQSIYTKISSSYPETYFSFYSPIERLWQFTLGGLCFFFIDRFENGFINLPKKFNRVILMLLILMVFAPFHMGLKTSSLLACLISIFIIIFRSLQLLPDPIFLKLKWLGDRSYSIYLIHMPVLYLAKYSPVMSLGDDKNRIVQTVFGVILTIFLGAITYSVVEERFRFRKSSKVLTLKYTAFSLSLILLVPVGLFIGLDHGQKHIHWGLEKNLYQPAYAGELDPNCRRDSIQGPPCIYKNAGASKTVLLIGDSHAGHISEALINAAKSENWNTIVWTHAGCAVRFQRNEKHLVTDSCLKANEAMREFVLKNRPSAIIVSEFVQSYSSQTDLQNALRILKSIVLNILLIQNSPVFPDSKDFMVPRPIIMSPYKPPKKFVYPAMEYEDKSASDLLVKWATANGITTMNFEALFCKSDICSRYSGSDWLYRDADHFSVIGAELTIPQLSNYLRNL